MRISDWSSDVCSSDLDPLGAVVHLVEPAPEDGRGMHRAMPGVDTELQRQQAAGDLEHERQGARIEQAMGAEQAVPQRWCEGGDGEIEHREGDALQPPETDVRKVARAGDEIEGAKGAEQPGSYVMISAEHDCLPMRLRRTL